MAQSILILNADLNLSGFHVAHQKQQQVWEDARFDTDQNQIFPLPGKAFNAKSLRCLHVDDDW